MKSVWVQLINQGFPDFTKAYSKKLTQTCRLNNDINSYLEQSRRNQLQLGRRLVKEIIDAERLRQ